MDVSRICLLGGTGFVGRAVADAAYARGLARLRVLTRSEPRARALRVVPTLEVMVGDPYDDGDLAAAFEEMDAVVNLVGILHPRGGETFARTHAQLPGRVARACRASGVRHLVHVSALGAASAAPSEYLRSKAAGEDALRREADTVAWTILRPSVIFGQEDRFLNLFARLVGTFPVVPLAGARARFQPIWVEDVARAVVAVLGQTRAFGRAYDLCGPRAYTLEALVRFVADTLGRRPRIVALPDALARLQAAVLEHLPGRLMTRDNLRSMQVDNVCAGGFPALFGFQPTALEAIVPGYMTAASSRARYPRYRDHAGR